MSNPISIPRWEITPEQKAYNRGWENCKTEISKLLLEYLSCDTWDFDKKSEIIKKINEL